MNKNSATVRVRDYSAAAVRLQRAADSYCTCKMYIYSTHYPWVLRCCCSSFV